MLAQQGMTIDRIRVRNEAARCWSRKLREMAIEGSIVTPAEIEQEYRKKNDQIKIQYVKLTQDKYKKDAEPTARRCSSTSRPMPRATRIRKRRTW